MNLKKIYNILRRKNFKKMQNYACSALSAWDARSHNSPGNYRQPLFKNSWATGIRDWCGLIFEEKKPVTML